MTEETFSARPEITRRLLIEGRVQGVGFRWSLMEKARELMLDGWVRNRRDGSVEALVSGPVEAVERLVVWAHRGPPGARVDRVACRDEGREASCVGFVRRPSL
ncbi:MAG: acylphosphatase [Candidatus Accumulibacter sp.]|jgi:acylphosphatase|nr:acylphosphatase [Accumulibacter sp.]